MIGKVLDEEEKMKNQRIQVATHVEDLLGLPVGSAILTRYRQVLELDEIEADTGRADAGKRYWIQPGTLSPVGVQDIPLPAFILPPVDAR
jgi:hypothetical protein